jgi:TonB-linked SusC/RagA family outer membrane protein
MHLSQLLKAMKLTSVLLLAAFLQLSAKSHGQRVTLNLKNAPVKAVFKAIRQQTGLNFFVVDAVRLNQAGRVTLNVENREVQEVLQLALAGEPLQFLVESGSVIIKPKPTISLLPAPSAADSTGVVTGVVLDEKNKPIPGATIRVKGTLVGTTSNQQGHFRVMAKPGNVLSVTFLGYAPREVTVRNAGALSIRLEPSSEALKDVVVTGMMTRNKQTFSGATTVFTGEQLRTVSNVNVVQSLRTLDPSFLVMENNLKGSNPNVLPTIELRGQTSISTDGLRDQFSTDPNQPLFILDGFETNLRSIMDLDINRVASITILKDAASTAMYGSRASNGVVVVETLRPQSGETKISYTNDLTFELPDLSSYNRMNAREKLAFEQLSGVYIPDSYYENYEHLYSYYMPLYSKRLQEVERGVNSYWLSDPLQTGVSQRHSLYASGGSGAVVFEAGGNYRKLKGVMIGSGREDWGTRLNLTYRAGKLNVNNMLYINGYTAEESPYGEFSTWVNTIPYYRKLPASERYLEVVKSKGRDGTGVDSLRVANPLYNASLTSFNKSKYYTIQNNLQLNYDIMNSLRFQANLQVTNDNLTETVFTSPLHTRYRETPLERKGEYAYRQMGGPAYAANAMLSYFKVVDVHSITANLRAEMQENKNKVEGYNSEGFPTASNGNPRFAYGYAENGTPAAASSVTRRNAVLASVNYSYDARYNADLTFRYDGSTAFGANNPYSPYYSIGASWNLEKERFMQRNKWIDMLRLRGNIGLTGNQNFNSYTSLSTYSYSRNHNHMGQGVLLQTLGNPDLEWQSTLQTSLGMDAGFLKGRLSMQLNWYKKLTDPLVVAITLPSSTGLSAYPFNTGSLTVEGAEFNVRYSPVYHPGNGLVWTVGVMGSWYKQVYGHLDTKLDGVNEKLKESNSLTRYRDGYSPDDIWAVPSAGIDPATGREIFIKQNGDLTMDFDYRDQAVVGNTRPLVQGVVNNSLTYRGFYMSLNFRYIFGQDVFNRALYDRVENISYTNIVNNNQDKRALYDRWKKPGDVAHFKGIALLSTTPMSSRFVQTENTLTLEAASLGYQFRHAPWLQKLRLSNLRISGLTNEVLRISTVKRERGIDYPYARSFSFSLTANFR